MSFLGYLKVYCTKFEQFGIIMSYAPDKQTNKQTKLNILPTANSCVCVCMHPAYWIDIGDVTYDYSKRYCIVLNADQSSSAV